MGTITEAKPVKNADLGGEVNCKPSVCNKKPANKKVPASTPPVAPWDSPLALRHLASHNPPRATVASEKRSARNSTGEMSRSAVFTMVKVAPQMSVLSPSAKSALRRFNPGSRLDLASAAGVTAGSVLAPSRALPVGTILVWYGHRRRLLRHRWRWPGCRAKWECSH